MAVPNIFGTATSAIPLSQLDTNFATPVTIGNTAVQLGNTVTSFGNVTLTNVTISSGNVTVSAGSNTSPSITTVGDTNTGIFFPAADTIAFSEGGAEAMRIDSSGNLGIGVTPSAWTNNKALEIGSVGNGFWGFNSTEFNVFQNSYYGSGFKYAGTGLASRYEQNTGKHAWYTAPTGTAGNAITFTQAMTLDASGNLLVGTTSSTAKFRVLSTASQTNGAYITHPTSTQDVISCENSATSGNNTFIQFYTDATVARGSISYNRAAGLVAYGTTSDYRAKDINGSITNSGALIDSTPVYMGKMKGATQERPMFIAHETPDYAHTGEKDAVDADGNPVYQQMDATALVPVMWAEIQLLRKRLAALESN